MRNEVMPKKKVTRLDMDIRASLGTNKRIDTRLTGVYNYQTMLVHFKMITGSQEFPNEH